MLKSAREKVRAFLQERQERAAARKAERALHDHSHGRFFLLHVPATATICAAIVEWYWALLFCIEATGAVDWNWRTAFGSQGVTDGAWNFAFEAHLPVLFGLVCATIPIVMLSMVWLPVQFAMRGAGRWRRGTVIFVGLLANILVIVSGTVVMNYNRQDQVREALVVEQTAMQGRAAIQAQIDAVNADLERLSDRRVNNEYAATAANVGAAAYRAQYMSEEALQRSPAMRRDIIVRALGAAERADALRAERTELIRQLALAPTEAAVAANVEDNVGRELNTFAQYVEVWRPPFVAVICTLIGIFGAWWTLALLQGLNPRDVLRSGWADESHRIEDLREEPAAQPEPMKPPREVVTDAETGEELVKVRPREYWRKRVPKKGKPTKVEVEPEIPPDETGVAVDGGNRQAVASEYAPVSAEEAQPEQPRTESADDRPAKETSDEADQQIDSGTVQDETLTEEEAAAVAAAEAELAAVIGESDGALGGADDTPRNDAPEQVADEEQGDAEEDVAVSEQPTHPVSEAHDSPPEQHEEHPAPEQGGQDDERAEAHEPEARKEPETNPGRLIAAE